MTDVRSYQYPPPPPPNGAEMDMPPSGYYSAQAASGMDMRSGPDSGIPSRERSVSFSKSMKLERSLSIPTGGPPSSQASQQQPPTPQQPGTPDALTLAGEKRRNKLGYHRTSVACGHCRRRKIRCIPSQNDVQGRCVNCIRLKKECSFFPVDQQPTPQDTRQKSASRSSIGPKIASASSSPAMQTGIPSDIHGQQPYPQLTMPSMPPPMKPAGTESYTPDSKLPSSSRPYEYGHHGMTNWMSADASPSSSKPSDLNTTWRTYPAESPVTAAFSPYTPHAPPPSATWSASVGSESSSRDEIAWSSYPAPPPRSLSFGAEGMSSHQQYPSISQMSGHSSRSYDRKSGSIPADMYPPPIATTIPGIETVPGTTLEHGVSLSAGAVPPSTYGSWQQSYSYSKPDSYGAWYGEAGAQQHEHHPSGHHSGSNMYYER
ncbi:hypothetical protein B0T26DRAFT_635680 [Lasiosphaeria miniovina]|uniref:Zn(2)-C6 fungal-type domain-containing protein n=1 Tax=Lasiosphaeria miniovina TaxID=1954250 RepID=A0AA40BFV4_9PEZI|nr:uncharacterized protein B0T26DRAFT_635680 [Lasiosphaeria miniovina]KAK0733479.1 hypothetical protein B0T26DRAFT_635680 [Lasiosphaeria miniovina]